MPIPDYQSVMKPLLQLALDQREHSVPESVELLAKHFDLSAQERSVLLPSGTQELFDNRVAWARTYLKKAGLIESSGRGRFHISKRGIQVLRENPAEIDTKFLRQFPEFQDFQRRSSAPGPAAATDLMPHAESAATPEETLDSSYQELRQTLAQELLDLVKTSSPRFFEKAVVKLLVAMGYGGSQRDAGNAVGRSGDGGIDGIIKEDKLGLDAVYIQAKRWEATVGRPVVQAFAGSLEGYKARKGVLITTSRFSQDAHDYVKHLERRIVLIDGEALAQLMMDHAVDVENVATYTVQKLDHNFFQDAD